MTRRKHPRVEPIVVDKHLDGEALAAILGRRAMSAAMVKPKRKYVGRYADDEDFSDVLYLAWENEVAAISADGALIDKACRFERQLPKAECCLRGVIVLPLGKAAQVAILRRFVDGKLVPIATRKGDAIPRTLLELEDYNIGIDLRQDPPRVIHLCDCEE